MEPVSAAVALLGLIGKLADDGAKTVSLVQQVTKYLDGVSAKKKNDKAQNLDSLFSRIRELFGADLLLRCARDLYIGKWITIAGDVRPLDDFRSAIAIASLLLIDHEDPERDEILDAVGRLSSGASKELVQWAVEDNRKINSDPSYAKIRSQFYNELTSVGLMSADEKASPSRSILRICGYTFLVSLGLSVIFALTPNKNAAGFFFVLAELSGAIGFITAFWRSAPSQRQVTNVSLTPRGEKLADSLRTVQVRIRVARRG